MYILRTGIIGGYRAPGGLPTTAVTAIPYTQMLSGIPSIHQVAHVGVTYLGQIDVPNEYAINWEVINPLTRIVVLSGTGNQISFTPSESDWGKAFDVRIIVVWQGGQLERYLRRGIRGVTYPPFTAGQSGVTQVDVNTHSGFQTSPFATNKIRMTGIRNGGSMNLNNLTIPGQNVEIQLQPTSGVPCTFNPGSTLAFKLGYGCHNVMVNGCTDNTVQYGGLLSPTYGNGEGFNIDPGYSGQSDYSDNIIICGIRAQNGTVGYHIVPPRNNPDVAGTGPYPVTQLPGFRLFNCDALGTQTEGFYMGWTRDYEGYAELLGPVYHHCRAYLCGWDGLQPGNSIDCEIHNFDVIEPSQLLNSNQWSGISLNGSTGWIHHSSITDAKNSFSGSTGYNHKGWHIFRNQITNSLTNNIQDSWFRLENTTVTPAYMLVYRNVFDVIKEPFRPYIQPDIFGGTNTATLQWQYDNNVELNTTNPTYTGSQLFQAAYTEHFMSIYDYNGYRVL